MKNVLLFSFFKSNNLGDRLLSEEIYRTIVKIVPEVIAIDFSTLKTIYNGESSPLERGETGNFFFANIKNHIKYHLTGLILLIKRFVDNKVDVSIREKIQNCNCIIFGGGNLIMDFDTPEWALRLANIARHANKYSKDYYFIGIGIGPVNNKKSIALFSSVLNQSKLVVVRDRQSCDYARYLGVQKKIEISIDPIFYSRWPYKEKTEIRRNLAICILSKICFASNEQYDEYILMLDAVIAKLTSHFTSISLFSTELADYDSINDFSQNLLDKSNIKIVMISNIQELLNLYASCEILIGGRMHSMIIAQKIALPFVAIEWQEKIRAFMNLISSTAYLYKPSRENNNTDAIITAVISLRENIESKKNSMKILNETICRNNLSPDAIFRNIFSSKRDTSDFGRTKNAH